MLPEQRAGPGTSQGCRGRLLAGGECRGVCCLSALLAPEPACFMEVILKLFSVLYGQDL